MIAARTQVKEIVKDCGINNISDEFMAQLEQKIKEVVEEACKRAKENGRRTVMGKDV